MEVPLMWSNESENDSYMRLKRSNDVIHLINYLRMDAGTHGTQCAHQH